MSTDALAIRRAVAAARRVCPAADLDNVAEISIQLGAPIAVVKGILFDQITAAAPPAGVITFHRAPLTAVLGANRRSA